MKLTRLPLVAWLLALFGCGQPAFVATDVNGVPNLAVIAPRLVRMGQPESPEAWMYLANRFGQNVTLVKLNEDGEAIDTPPAGWRFIRAGIPPFDDRPWTALEKPDPVRVQGIVNTIVDAYRRGDVVIWHCTAGRDRTSLVSALVQMRLFGMTKSAAWADMIAHGFRWELPNLDAYWLGDVP